MLFFKNYILETDLTQSRKYLVFYFIECKSSEMAELPARLIDWFHVLKVNEKVQEMKDQRIEQEPVMKEESFTDEKLRSMCK